MIIDLFTNDEPEHRHVTNGLARGLMAAKHDVMIMPHPCQKRVGCQLMVEVGALLTDNFAGVPFVHWILEPIQTVPAQWIQAMMGGHLFFFADYDSSIRAHQQGVRTAEYLPMGWDSLIPHKPKEDRKEEIQLGYFGNPNPQIVAVLAEVRKEYPAWKIGVWGNSELWGKTVFGDCVVSDIPYEDRDVLPQMDRCRYVLDDIRSNRPGFFFMQACASQAVGLAPYSADRFDLFGQSEFMYGLEEKTGRPLIVNRIKSINHGTGYRGVKQDQTQAVGSRDVPTWGRLVDMTYGGSGRNRLMDRAFYLLALLESKSLYEVAKTCCKEHKPVKYEVEDKEPWEYIHLNFPYEGDRRQFDFKWGGKGFTAEEVPTILRIAAKRIEMSVVNNAYKENIAVSVKPEVPKA